MFTLKSENTFTWEVRIKVPQDKKHLVQSINVEFKVITKSRLAEISEGPGTDSEEALIREVVIGWDKSVQAEDGKPLPFTADNLAALVNIPYVRIAIADAYTQAIAGDRYLAKN